MNPLLSMTLLVALTAQAQAQAGAADARTQAIAPFVGDEVAVVVHLDLTKLDVNALARRVLGGITDEEEIETVTRAAVGWTGGLRRAGAQDVYILIDLLDLPGAPVAVVPLAEGTDAEAVGKVLCGGGGDGDAPMLFAWPTCATLKGAVFAGTAEALERVRQAEPAVRPEVAAAFATAGEAPVQILLVPSATQRRVIEEMVPNLPRELGSGPITVVTEGLTWAAIVLEAEPKATLRVIVQAKGPAAAKNLNDLVRSARDVARKVLERPAPEGLPELAAALDDLKPVVEGNRLTLDVDLKDARDLVSGPLSQAREATYRSQCTNNLKQLGLAMHNYHNNHKHFPAAAITDDDGKPLLSWRVAVLPYLDQQQALYNEFHLDEPWDSPHNKALIDRMPAVYHCPSTPGRLDAEGKTTYLVPRGKSTIFPDRAEGVTLKEITDGTSNTILIVDAGPDHAVVWTKPEDWEVGADSEMSALIGSHPEGATTLFADGSAHFLPKAVDAEIFRGLLTRDGGEVISYDQIHP